MPLLVNKPNIYALESIKDFVWTSVSQITLPASSIVINDYLYTAGNLVFDFANGVGDNGLDSGVEASNQWYALYAVPGASGAYKLKASVNLPSQLGGTGPIGFSSYRYLGVFRNGDSASVSSDILKFLKTKNRTIFENDLGLRLQTGTGDIIWAKSISMSGASIPFNSFCRISGIGGQSGGRLILQTSPNSSAIIFAATNSVQPSTLLQMDVAIDSYLTNIQVLGRNSSDVGAGTSNLYLISWTDPVL